jgi:hypothetical protein
LRVQARKGDARGRGLAAELALACRVDLSALSSRALHVDVEVGLLGAVDELDLAVVEVHEPQLEAAIFLLLLLLGEAPGGALAIELEAGRRVARADVRHDHAPPEERGTRTRAYRPSASTRLGVFAHEGLEMRSLRG